MLRQRVLDIMRTRRYRLWAIVLAGITLIMTQLPLVNDFGFEFAVGTALMIAYAAGCLSAIHFTDRQHLTASPYPPGLELWPVGLTNFILLAPPFLVMSVKSVLSGLCNYPEGLAFYILIPGVTALLATAVGALCGLIIARPRRACLLFIGYTLLSFSIGVYRLLTQPPVFAYNPIIGYFPGPIYDEVVRITPTLLIARGCAILQAIFIIAGLALCIDPDRRRIDPRRLLRRLSWPHEAGLRVARASFLIALAGLALTYVYRAPLGVVIDRAYIQETLGGYKRTPHFDIYYDINAETARRIDLIALDHEFQYTRLAQFLDVSPTQRIRSYIYASPDQKKGLMGARYTSIERPGGDEMHLNDEPFPHPVMKHELAHVLSSSFGNRLYGGSYRMGFHEGLAVAADWRVDQLTPHQWSRGMRQLGLAPSLENIIGTIGFWTEAPSRSYTLCGSFVRFLIDRYGIDTFKHAFPSGDVEGAYQQSISTLVDEWEAFIDGITLSEQELRIARQRFLRPGIFERRCAHEVAALIDRAWQSYRAQRYPDAIRTFDRVRQFEPENPSALRGLLYATYRTRNDQRATAIGDSILGQPDRIVGLLTDAYLIQGDIAWKRGDVDRARERYGQALNLHAADRTDREALVKLDALDHPGVTDWVLSYLLAERDQGGHVVLVKEAIDQAPHFAAGAYLIGRRLFSTGAYRHGLPYLIQADTLSLSDPLLVLENKRLIGQSFFYTDEYDRGIEAFQQLIAITTSEAVKTRTEDWIARCRWFRDHRDAGNEDG